MRLWTTGRLHLSRCEIVTDEQFIRMLFFDCMIDKQMTVSNDSVSASRQLKF